MDQRKSFLLRINASLWRELEAWAQEDLRSVNGQVEFLLRQAVLKQRGGRLAGADPASPPAADASEPPTTSAPADSPPPEAAPGS